MRVLVTGGNGYVGRVLTRLLLAEYEVAVLDNLRIGGMRLSENDLSRIRLFKTDLREHEGVAATLKEFQPDAIVHLAAIHFIPECEANPADAIATNVTGTVNLLRSCLPETRFIYASTAAVYAPEERPHCEARSVIGPMDVYGMTKLHAEQYVRYWSKLKNLNSVIVRLFNVIGPGETNPHILPAILAQAMQNELKLRLGNCHPRRDYIDVQDAAAGFAAILRAKANGSSNASSGNGSSGNGSSVDVVNLGTGCAYSVYDIVDELARVSGRNFSIETDPGRVRQSDRPFLAADTTRIRQRYGWSPKMNLRSSLEALWADPDIPSKLLEVS